jgi:starch-binding outer membrane protein, SusD/RagB family
LVRKRAGLTDVSGVTLDTQLLERRHEFAGEGLRWHDLIRSGKILEIMSAWDAVDDLENKIKPMTIDEIIYPIPQTQLTISPGLYSQNPGYN